MDIFESEKGYYKKCEENGLRKKKRKILRPKKSNSPDTKLFFKGKKLGKTSPKKSGKKNELLKVEIPNNKEKFDPGSTFSNKKTFKRPNSVTHKSFANYLDLDCKTRNINRHSNPSIIEKIIKNSLQKAKVKRKSEEKEQQLVKLHNNIRKHELSYQNQQIRMQNSQKLKKKLKNKKKRIFTPDLNNLNTIKTDKTNWIRKSESPELTKINKRSTSVEADFSKKSKKGNLAHLNSKKPQKKVLNGSIKKNFLNEAYLPSFNIDQSFLNQSSANFSKIFKENDEKTEEKSRNISFFVDKNSEYSLDEIDECVQNTVYTLPDSFQDVLYSQPTKSSEQKKGKVLSGEIFISDDKFLSFEIEAQHELSLFPLKKHLVIETQQENTLVFGKTRQKTEFSVQPLPENNVFIKSADACLKIDQLSFQNISIYPNLKKKTLKIETFPQLSCQKKLQKDYQSLLEDQLS